MTSQRIIRSYLIIAGLYTLSASLIWGVNTLFLLEAGLSILEVFIANAVFTAGMAFFEIPTGVLADTVGRRTSFLLSAVVLALGTFGYVIVGRVGGGLLLFSFMSVILGLGYTFYSGAVEAWLVDALNATGFSGSLDGVFSRGGVISSGAMLVGTVSGGILGDFDLALPFVLRGVLLLILFGIAWFLMHDLGYTARVLNWNHIPREMNKILQASLKFGWQRPGLRLLMAVGLIDTAFFSWAWYAWQPYFLKLLGMDAVWVAGVIAAVLSIAMIVGNGLVSLLARYFKRRTAAMTLAVTLYTGCAIGVGLTDDFMVAVTLFTFSVVMVGILRPVRQAYMHQSIPSSERATIISLDSMVGSTGGIVGQTGLGWLSQSGGFGLGYLIGGLFTGLMLPLTLRLRSRHEAIDEFHFNALAQEGTLKLSDLE